MTIMMITMMMMMLTCVRLAEDQVLALRLLFLSLLQGFAPAHHNCHHHNYHLHLHHSEDDYLGILNTDGPFLSTSPPLHQLDPLHTEPDHHGGVGGGDSGADGD